MIHIDNRSSTPVLHIPDTSSCGSHKPDDLTSLIQVKAEAESPVKDFRSSALVEALTSTPGASPIVVEPQAHLMHSPSPQSLSMFAPPATSMHLPNHFDIKPASSSSYSPFNGSAFQLMSPSLPPLPQSLAQGAQPLLRSPTSSPTKAKLPRDPKSVPCKGNNCLF